MYVWSLAFIVFLAGCIGPDREKVCEQYQMKVEVYESYYNKQDCHLDSEDRRRLITAKVGVIEWCANEGRRSNDVYPN